MRGAGLLAPQVPISPPPHGGLTLPPWQQPSPNPCKGTRLGRDPQDALHKAAWYPVPGGTFSAQLGVRSDTFCGAMLSWGPRRTDLGCMSWCLLPS